MNVFVFDIETVPDVKAGRQLLGLEGLSDAEVAAAMMALRRQQTNGASDFLRHHVQQIVCISAVLRRCDQFQVWSLGDLNSSECDIIERFFLGLEKFTPTLVSWNGSGFDLPVLHYRALIHGVTAPRYWEVGEQDRDFRFNNYLSRYHHRHLDLMDVLSGYQPRAAASLDEIATMLGFPGKMGMSGAKVWEYFQEHNIEKIRNYCETDVLNTYLVYLRFEFMRGKLTLQQYQQESKFVRESLQHLNKSHLNEFLAAWPDVTIAS